MILDRNVVVRIIPLTFPDQARWPPPEPIYRLHHLDDNEEEAPILLLQVRACLLANGEADIDELPMTRKGSKHPGAKVPCWADRNLFSSINIKNISFKVDLTPVSSWACLASPPLWSAKWRLEKAATRIVQKRTVSSHPPLCTSHAAFQADTCANPGLPQWIVKNALATCYILSSCYKATPGFNDELYSETNLLIHYPSVIPIAKLGPYSCSDPIFRRVCSQSEAAPHASNLPFATIDQIYYTNIPL